MVDSTQYILGKFPNKTPNSAGEIHTTCPFHDDKSPSFSINVNLGVFVCGSARCGVRGNFVQFYKLMEGIDSWSEVYRRLKTPRIAKDFEDLFAPKVLRTKQYTTSPFPSEVEPIRSVRYLAERNLGMEVIDTFGLLYGISGHSAGVSITDTLVVPVYDLNGTYATFQVRYLHPLSKMRWKSPSNSPIHNLLYGGWLISGAAKDLWIVEGASDVWNLYRLGVQAVGLFTKQASDSQLNRLRSLCFSFGLRPIVCLDGDVPEKVVNALYSELSAFELNPKIVQLEQGEDPGNLSIKRFQILCEGLT